MGVRTHVHWTTLLFAGLLLAFCGCDRDSGSAARQSAARPQLRVGHVGHDHQLALYVAALKGERLSPAGPFLREVQAREVYDLIQNGQAIARLRFVKVGGGAEMPAAMARGEIDIGLGGLMPVAKFADEGQPLRIIAPLQTDGDMLVMRSASPVNDWAGFVAAAKAATKPLKIGYKAPTAGAKMIFERALKAEDIPWSLDPADVSARVLLVNMGSEKSHLPLLESGAIDGFVMNQPAPAQAVHKGLGKIVADLCDMPPRGKWVQHPCCCIAATQQTLDQHPQQVKALLKVILLATQSINADSAGAIDCAVEWTKTEKPVEQASVPTVRYSAEPTEQWFSGVRTWAEMVKEIQFFKGKYVAMTADAFMQDLCVLDLCREAAAELREAGQLK